MTRLEWGTPGSRRYETGIDQGVLYVGANPGVPWVGLSAVDENPSGGEAKPYYIDGVKYLNVSSAEEYEASISAFTYPDLFTECDGSKQVRAGLFFSQQRRKSFGFAYRSLVGTDLNPDHGYKINLVYNALAAPTSKTHSTISDSAEPSTFSWNITTKPPAVAGYKRTAHIVIDSRTTDTVVLQAVEDAIYGDAENPPRLPTVAEIIGFYDAFYSFVVTDNGDGTYTVSGPDEAIQALDADFLQITWPTVVEVDPNTYTISTG